MDLKQIEKLMSAMGRSQIKRLALKEEGFEIELERESAHEEGSYVVVPRHHEAPPPLPAQVGTPAAQTVDTGSSQFVTSPMVGTFYASPSPDEPPYIKVGDRIDEASVVCIIEAMKVMNEVKAQCKGMIAEILVKNGDPVEFGTKIFRVE